MRRVPLLAAAGACAALSQAPLARADNPAALTSSGASDAALTERTAPELDLPNSRRGGFVIGGSFGVGLAGSAGYPNDLNFIGDPGYYSASGLMAGGGGSGFLMGALTDYLSFGFWFGDAVFNNASWHSIGEGGGLRVELFPLFGLGGVFRDLGVFTQVGIGGTELVYRDKPGVTSDGVGSFLGGGVFYEIRLFKLGKGHVAAGPSLEYDSIFAQPIERHGALLGARLLWYLGK